jgi:hypothetical protein
MSLNLQVAKNNFELDNCLIGSTIKEGCVVLANWVTGKRIIFNNTTYNTLTKPVGAYMVYLKKEFIPQGISEKHAFTKRKGYTSSYTASIEIKATAGFNVFGCETSLEVTTGFSYTSTIEEETTETWERTVTGPAEFWTYQPVLVYATQIRDTPDMRSYLQRDYFSKNGKLYIFTPVFRNSPTVSNTPVNPLDYKDFTNYLINDGFSKWYNETVTQPIDLPRYILIQADNQQYLSRMGPTGLEFSKSSPDEYCRFRVEKVDENHVAFRADNDNWFSRMGPQDIECSKSGLDEYCKFEIVEYFDGNLKLRADTGKYLSRYSSYLKAAKTFLDPYCTFKIYPA